MRRRIGPVHPLAKLTTDRLAKVGDAPFISAVRRGRQGSEEPPSSARMLGVLMTNIAKVLDFVTRFPGSDDDEIAAALKILPRQQVNQICRRLESEGKLSRSRGPEGKIVNTRR